METISYQEAVDTAHAWKDQWSSIEKHYAYRTVAHDLGHGQFEVLITRADRFATTPEFKTVKTPAERDIANAERAARRAKSQIRRKIKSMGTDTMLTLTYRQNQLDEDLAKVHIKEFIRRMNRVIKGFAYVVAYERQTRGAWHMHLAIHRVQSHYLYLGFLVKSFDLVRSVWRSVTGELGGNIDLQMRRRAGKKTIAQLAAYISKYISKSFDLVGDERIWKKRYTSSRHDMPEAIVQGHIRRDLISLVHEAVERFTTCSGCAFRACIVDGGKGIFFTIDPPVNTRA